MTGTIVRDAQLETTIRGALELATDALLTVIADVHKQRAFALVKMGRFAEAEASDLEALRLTEASDLEAPIFDKVGGMNKDWFRFPTKPSH